MSNRAFIRSNKRAKAAHYRKKSASQARARRQERTADWSNPDWVAEHDRKALAGYTSLVNMGLEPKRAARVAKRAML